MWRKGGEEKEWVVGKGGGEERGSRKMKEGVGKEREKEERKRNGQ